ncbi:MAG: hypothetical protein AAF483_18035, partial [Planctomycetota bacterium]
PAVAGRPGRSRVPPSAPGRLVWSPRFKMIWFFVLAILVALALFIVRSAEQGDALAKALVGICIFLAAIAIFSSVSFLFSFFFGSLGKAIEGPEYRIGNPFIDESMPDQLVQPRPTDAD